MQRILEGIKVLDLTRVLAGPFCTMVLADHGAEVIKIENPDGGDDSRGFGPFVNNESAYFMSVNRNKKSVTLNLKKAEERDIFTEMVKDADVVVENYRPGTMERLGLGYESLKELNDSIIYASCSGFGHSGPHKGKPAYDIIIQGMGGIMSITGPDGDSPTRVGASIGDLTAALYTALGIIMALFARERTGEGQKVDVSMLDCQVSILENAIARYFFGGVPPEPLGNRHPSITPFTAFETSDSHLIVGVGNNSLWAKFCGVLEREDLIFDERFAENSSRTENWEELEPVLSEIMLRDTTDNWLTKLEKEGIPCGPINNIEQVAAHPQVKAREMILEIEHKIAGKIKVPGIPIKFSRTPGEVKDPPPLLGEHNDEVLGKYMRAAAE